MGRTRQRHRRPRRSPGGARVMERRTRILGLGTYTSSHRGRMGIRGPRRRRTTPLPPPGGGDELTPDEVHRCNIWQGHFPTKNTHADGHAGTSPVDTFSPNAFGLHDMAGNVWEGCSDWWTTNHDTTHLHNPTGPTTGPTNGHAKAARGGSYLCHDSYCNCYRVASRTNNTPDRSSGNTGSRCVTPAPRSWRGMKTSFPTMH